MSSPSGSPQRQATIITMLHDEQEVTSAIQYSRHGELAMYTTSPAATSQLRARSRSRNSVVAASPMIARFAAENQRLRGESKQLRAAQAHWETSVGAKGH